MYTCIKSATLTALNLSAKLADMLVMEGLTANEMAALLGLPTNTILQRLNRAGIKPFCKDALYTADDLEIIRNVSMGRPPKKTDAPTDA
jgi:hypothetical protein